MSELLDRRTVLTSAAVLSLSGASALLDRMAAPARTGPGVSHAAATTVVAHRSGSARTLPSGFFGLNGNTLQQRLRWDRNDLDTALASLGPGTLRYPGGTIGNYWDWRAGWFQPGGPWPGQTLDGGGPVITPFDDSLTPFGQAISRSGAAGVFVLNMLTVNGRLGTSADNQTMITDQVAFLRAAANAGMSVRRVELGNEFYLTGALPGAHGNDYSTRFPTATTYATQANPWISAVRAAFPAAQVAAVGADATGNNSPRREGWNAAVIAAVTGVNALTLHPYVVVRDATAAPQSLLSLPYKRVQSLAATEFKQLSAAGLSAWVTEFNMVDHTPALTFAGTWTHGLFMAAYGLLLAQHNVVTLVDVHNVVGPAVAGILFDSTAGFGASGPPTQFLARSAMGTTFAILLQAVRAATTGQALTFTGGPVLAGNAPGLVGMEFTGATRHQAVIVNLAANAVSVDLSQVFAGTYSWSRTSAAALTTRITGPGSVNVVYGNASGAVNLPAHAVLTISA
jgi:hypothetical protein